MCLGFIVANSFFLILLLFIFYGLQKGALETVQKAFVAELSPEQFRASSLGGFQMVTGLLWDNFGKEATMIYSIVLSIISFGLLFWVKEDQNN
ncbi:MAG: hypothetical protein QME58_13150 [Bacteroidota bacterium]|nr:hypothetical protein [Bacteroidota bacterium]